MKASQSLLFCIEIIKLGKFIVNGRKVVIEFVLSHNLVSHCNSQWLHRVAIRVVERADHVVEIVNNIFFELHFIEWL